MTDRPILFSAPMVRALLAGIKTQTRRTLSKQPSPFSELLKSADGWQWRDGTRGGSVDVRISRGDRLWVKETWRPFTIELAVWDIEVAYAADGERRIIKDGEFGDKDWTMPKAAERGNVSPLFMPRWASRLTLIVTDVRVQRLQDISEADAIAEGVPADFLEHIHGPGGYREIWDNINGAGAWEANPWVTTYTFTVHRGNIDEVSP